MSEAETYEELALKLAELQARVDGAGQAGAWIVVGVVVILICCAIVAFINNMYAH